MKKRRIRYILSVIIGIIILAGVIVFVRSPMGYSLLKSKRHFLTHPADPRVLYEPRAEGYAEKIAAFLPQAIDMVVAGHFKKFKKPFKVYVCASQKSHNEFIGNPTLYSIRGAARLGNVFIAPAAFSFKGFDTHRESLTHELSHLLLMQRTAFLSRPIPHWFSEGLANCIAGSGGEGISEIKAVHAILAGRHFILREKGSLFGSFRKKNFPGLTGPMFHRQNKMFVKFIQDFNPQAYRDLVIGIQEGGNFADSFLSHFKMTIKQMWQRFVNHIRTHDRVPGQAKKN